MLSHFDSPAASYASVPIKRFVSNGGCALYAYVRLWRGWPTHAQKKRVPFQATTPGGFSIIEASKKPLKSLTICSSLFSGSGWLLQPLNLQHRRHCVYHTRSHHTGAQHETTCDSHCLRNSIIEHSSMRTQRAVRMHWISTGQLRAMCPMP